MIMMKGLEYTMNYQSTRNSSEQVSAAEAILQGLSKDGGLFVPEEFPRISLSELDDLAKNHPSYTERASKILSLFLTDFSQGQIANCVEKAYQTKKFDEKNNAVTRLQGISAQKQEWSLELWHGPTCAFKDMALQLLPYLMTTSADILKNDKEIVILVATSGDTGKAALEGFKDVKGTRIIVFYPEDGVSPMQKRQMVTQEGKNVTVCAIKGNFDDAQTAVKSIFSDLSLREWMNEKNMRFSSANSINLGRLLPQIVYYFTAYCDLIDKGEIKAAGEPINICVPTGNFGNILAAYYAKRMGLPVNKLICASNENHILTDFIQTGVYDRNREFHQTISPSMDILISSNLERLLFELSGRDDQLIKRLYEELSSTGKFTVLPEMKNRLQEEFYAGYCSDEMTQKTISEVFHSDENHYLLDPHTAVAVRVYRDYLKETGDTFTKTVIASTANPYKFVSNVLSAVSSEATADNEYGQMEQLLGLSGLEIPRQLNDLKEKEIRFRTSIEKDEIKEEVVKILSE